MPGAQASKINRGRIGVYIFQTPERLPPHPVVPHLYCSPCAPSGAQPQDGSDKKVIREPPPLPSSEKMPCTALLVEPFWRFYKQEVHQPRGPLINSKTAAAWGHPQACLSQGVRREVVRTGRCDSRSWAGARHARKPAPQKPRGQRWASEGPAWCL